LNPNIAYISKLSGIESEEFHKKHWGIYMASNNLKEFLEYRDRMNKRILDSDNLELRRFFALDSAVYREGALPERTKELIGLAASVVLRCNDCILYHLKQCIDKGVTDDEFEETLSIALVVGGSITIPHLRYAFEMIDKIRQSNGY